MLQGGMATFGQALQNLMQIGRDQANNQQADQRDFLAERRNQEAIRERQGRYAVSDANNERDFVRNMYTSDRNFGLQQQQEERAAAGQLYSQQLANDRLSLAENADTRMQTEADRIAAERAKAEAFNTQVAGSGAAASPTVQSLFDEQALGGVPIVGSVVNATPDNAPTTSDLAAQLAAEEQRAVAAEKSFNAPVATEARANAARIKQQIADRPTSNSKLTPYQLYQTERNARKDDATAAVAEEKAAVKQEEKVYADAAGLLTDADAFAPQAAFVPVGENGKPEPIAAAKAAKFDDNQFLAESAVAKEAKNKSEYIAKGGTSLTEDQKAKRGKFYDLVSGEKAAAAATLDAATAAQFLQQAAGDRAKARELARAAGYKF